MRSDLIKGCKTVMMELQGESSTRAAMLRAARAAGQTRLYSAYQTPCQPTNQKTWLQKYGTGERS